MNKQEEQLNALNDIRNMMDRSSRFISLSGLSGVFAGLTALVGAYFANDAIKNYAPKYHDTYTTNGEAMYAGFNNLVIEGKLILIAVIVMIVAILGGLLFTIRQSRKKNLPFWDKTSRNLLVNLAIPLATGGCFILAILYNNVGTYGLIAPSCLVFYGLGLINASKYTYSDIRFLGIFEVMLGIIAAFNVGYGLYFWAFGFGVLHIFYGLIMYFKYERAK
jgi:hypothetical protein